MQRKATSFDIAAMAGVSQPTVSRALRGSTSVSEETRKRIEAIALQLHYKVDKNASNLRSQHSNTLALLFFEDPAPDDSQINPFFLSMIGSITRACANRGLDLLISFQQLSEDWHKDFEDSRKADGLILLGYGDYDVYRGRLEQLARQGTHFVLWGAPPDAVAGACVGSNNFQGGYDAARHLIETGRRRIAFIGEASSRSPEFLARFEGFQKALREAGIAFDPKLQVPAVSDEAAGLRAAATLIHRKRPIDALLCASDLIAIGALRALQARGIAVPGDVAVVGFDDIPASRLTNPPLTTVAQDTRQAGEVLVETLCRLIAAETVASTALPVRLEVRESSANTNT